MNLHAPTKRPEFQKMLAYCEKNKKSTSHLIVADLSRLARSVYDQAQTLVNLKQWGIELISVDELISDATAARKLSRNILAAMNQFFSDSLSEKTKFRMTAGVKQGRWLWVAPLGYLNDKQTKPRLSTSRIDPEGVRIGREGLLDGVHFDPSHGVNDTDVETNPPANILANAANEFYAGWIVSGDIRVRGGHEPLISEDLFLRVQEKLERNKNAGHVYKIGQDDFPLRRFMRCATCDKNLTAGWVRGRNEKRYPRYWCFQKGCETSVSLEDLHESFCILLEQIQPTAEILAKLPSIVLLTLLTKRLMEVYDPSYVTASMIVAGTVFLVAWTAIFEHPRFTFSARAWLAVAAQGVLATALAYLLWNWGMARLPAAKAGIFFNLEPLVGTLLGVLVLNEKLGGLTILGGTMILCGAGYFSTRTNATETQ